MSRSGSASSSKKNTYRDGDGAGSSGLIGQDGVDPMFWGPYLAERQWGTVREDNSHDGSCWTSMTYEDATKIAYKWGEDGLLGVSDKYGLLCSSLALWNGRDSMLKERLFGLDSHEGNHGEDVKELYYYLDNTPTHNYMRALYKYPHREFPYEKLRQHGRSITEPEYEILETGSFDNKRYWDVQVEYAKPNNFDLICKYTITNQSSKRVKLYIIPQFYFRNTWNQSMHNKAFTKHEGQQQMTPNFQYHNINAIGVIYEGGLFTINITHSVNVVVQDLLFTNNETADSQLSNLNLEFTNLGTKDAFHRYIIENDQSAIRVDKNGTKCCAYMTCELGARDHATVYWQISPLDAKGEINAKRLDQTIKAERVKAEEFYRKVIPRGIPADQNNLCKQAIAGLLWSKQFYCLRMDEKNNDLLFEHGDSYYYSKCGKQRRQWKHLMCQDILLMPDKWEFPWFASWDTAFQAALYATLDIKFAQEQIKILLSDRYMHPNGQIPGCEFDFGDPNPPILAWAVWKIHKLEKPWNLEFIKSLYPRLLVNYQWWHKLDAKKTYLFGNGFLGLDNICAIDRSELPHGINTIKQADATGWMGQFALVMLKLTLEQCRYDICLTDMAVRFLRDFLLIAKAINEDIDNGGLWHDEDGFYYDVVHYGKQRTQPICLRTWSGIIPLLACGKINLEHAPMVKSFLMSSDRSFAPYVAKLSENDFFLTLVPYMRLKHVLNKVFDEDEFLSPFGIRSVSKIYKDNPFYFPYRGNDNMVTYQPGESDSDMFGGNSNWRGPIWMCLNYLLIEAMELYSELDKIFTQPLSMEFPSGKLDSQRKSFQAIAQDLCQRLVSLYTPDSRGVRPSNGDEDMYRERDWGDLALFYEYFNAETGKGCGASHQTGWSALYVEFIRKIVAFKIGIKKK